MAKLKGWVITSDRGYLYNTYRNPVWVGEVKEATVYDTEDAAKQALSVAHMLMYERRLCSVKESND